MSFEEWLNQVRDTLSSSDTANMRLAWNAATERAAKICDAYSAGFEAVQDAEGAAWCPHCKAYIRDAAGEISDAIREGK